MEIEILREALAKSVKKTELAALVATEGRFPMKTVAETLGVARSNLHDKVRQAAKPRASYRKPDDDYLLPLVRRLIGERPTYGYRRITALANRELGRTGKPGSNRGNSTDQPSRAKPGFELAVWHGVFAPRPLVGKCSPGGDIKTGQALLIRGRKIRHQRSAPRPTVRRSPSPVSRRSVGPPHRAG